MPWHFLTALLIRCFSCIRLWS